MQVREEMHYTYEGYYSIKITRIRDGKVLIDFRDDNIDMWRIGSSYIRSKFGLYRSLAGGRLDQDARGAEPAAEERFDLDYGLQGLREGFESDTRGSGRIGRIVRMNR